MIIFVSFAALITLRISFRSSSLSIAAVAGKSGGHIVPAMSLLQQVVDKGDISKVTFFSTDSELDKKIVNLYPFVSKYINLSLSSSPGKDIFKWPGFIIRASISFFKSLKSLYQAKPNVLISTGGIVALPVVLTAWVLGVPDIKIYALDAQPGKAALMLSKFANHIYVCFDEAKKYFQNNKVELVKYPIRFTHKDILSKQDACKFLGIDSNKKVLLILGGSQGSKFINDLMVEFAAWCPENFAKSFAIIHQAGSGDLNSIIYAYKKAGIESLVFNYTAQLQYCYCASDLVIARAGAGTLFELEFFNKKSIIIPLEADTTSHQVDNAKAMSQQRSDLFTYILQNTIEENKVKFFERIVA